MFPLTVCEAALDAVHSIHPTHATSLCAHLCFLYALPAALSTILTLTRKPHPPPKPHHISVILYAFYINTLHIIIIICT